jgi:hypothetical protein
MMYFVIFQNSNQWILIFVIKMKYWVNQYVLSWRQLCENDIFFINDLISLDNQKMYTFNEFVNTYNVNINFVEYYGIIRAIPNYWK